MKLDELLKTMVDKKASDLHLKVGRPPVIRLHGDLTPLEEYLRIKPNDMDDFIFDVLNDEDQLRLKKNKGIDVAYSLPGVSRFRVNILYQRGTLAMVIRTIPFDIPSIEDLGLPATVTNLARMNAGLVVVTGPAGSGKSTTLAAMIDYINKNYHKQIITIEDPIEYLFRDNLSSIVQREVGADTLTFAEGLRMVFRQDPDVIVIGEMRDLETVSAAMSAAETGHLVLSTLHTLDAAQTVDRIVDSFPQNQHRQIRIQLSQTLRGIVAQRLVPMKDKKGRAAAVEIMTNSPAISDHLLNGRTGDLYDSIRASVENFGMQTLEQSIVALMVHDKVDYETARNSCQRISELDSALRALYLDYV
ncbi:MAG TPA: type IV pilus twitching motility protein PilT [bacterium]|nr:type IV pilus twitching motility protein PilT [bacterium]